MPTATAPQEFAGLRLRDPESPPHFRRRECKPACAPADVEDVRIRPQRGVEAVQHRVVGAVGVQWPVGVPKTAVAVPLTVLRNIF